MSWCRSSALGFVLLVALAMPACGPRKGKLYGVATYGGKPVAGGVVLIQSAEQAQPIRAPVDADGHYTADSIPMGAAKVAVLPPPMATKPPPLPKDMDPKLLPPPAPPGLNIPRKYTAPETSGLTVTVTSSAQEYNIDLK
jgi:hypothetical protein